MSLLEVLDQMDRDRDRYVKELEELLKFERKRNAELTDLLMKATVANERKQLELILAGHFDGLREPQEGETDGNPNSDRFSGT